MDPIGIIILKPGEPRKLGVVLGNKMYEVDAEDLQKFLANKPVVGAAVQINSIHDYAIPMGPIGSTGGH